MDRRLKIAWTLCFLIITSIGLYSKSTSRLVERAVLTGGVKLCDFKL